MSAPEHAGEAEKGSDPQLTHESLACFAVPSLDAAESAVGSATDSLKREFNEYGLTVRAALSPLEEPD